MKKVIDNLEQEHILDHVLDHVCADCGHYQDSLLRECDSCGSFRVLLVSVAKELFGDDYQETLNGEKTLDHVCSTCGEHQDSSLRECDACGSTSVIPVNIAKELFGKGYTEVFGAVFN